MAFNGTSPFLWRGKDEGSGRGNELTSLWALAIFSPFHPFNFSPLNAFSPNKKSAPTRRRERSIHKNIDKKS